MLYRRSLAQAEVYVGCDFAAGWLAWPLAGLVQAYILKQLDAQKVPAGTWHFLTVILFTLMLALEALWWTDRGATF